MPAVILDHLHWVQLEQVQSAVNAQVRYVAEPQSWEPAVTEGDCTGYAMAKRQRLLELGWPASALRIATVVDERGEPHAVLTVDAAAPGAAPGTYVLDNRHADVEPWQQLAGYRWLERQGPSEYVWAYIGNPVTLLMGTADMAVRAAWAASTNAPDAVAPAPSAWGPRSNPRP